MTGAVALLAVAAAIPAPAAAQSTEPVFQVDLAADGDAAVSVTYAFALDGEDEQQAFREIRDNESARDAFATRFGDRLRSVAENAENATGREMSVENVSVDVESSGETGVVTLSADWRNLAATTERGLVVTEPFASGFTPDRQFVVTLPDGYAADATPEPTSAEDGRLVWSAGTSLDGFELVASSGSDAGDGSEGDGAAGTDAPTGEESTDEEGPGFGVAAALAGLVAAALLAYRRH